MKHIMLSVTAWIFAFVIMFVGIQGEVQAGVADVVIVCNNCQSPRNTAQFHGMQHGTGIKLVVDYDKERINAFSYEHDRERGVYMTLPINTPIQVAEVFDFWMILIEGASSTNLSEFDDDIATVRAHDGGNLTLNINADGSGVPWAHLPQNLSNKNAYDIVNSATTRSQVQSALSHGVFSANTGNPTWDSLSITMSETAFNVLANLSGVTSITFRITWKDGSQTSFRAVIGNLPEVQYVNGQSKDADGNKIPDASVTDTGSSGGPSYAGDYAFEKGSLADWISAAVRYGVPVSSGGRRNDTVTCSWDGSLLSCTQHPR